eukprot:592766_1
MARPGIIASKKGLVPPGPTGCDPGLTFFFQALNIPIKIGKGQIEISNRNLRTQPRRQQQLRRRQHWWVKKKATIKKSAAAKKKAAIQNKNTHDAQWASLLNPSIEFVVYAVREGMPTDCGFRAPRIAAKFSQN